EKTRRASVFFRARILIDFLRRSRRSWCSAIASSPLRSTIRTDRLPSRSDLSWPIINSLTYLLMITSGACLCQRGARGPSRHAPDARAHGRRDRDRPDIRPLRGRRLDGPQVVQEGRDVFQELRLGEVQLADRGGDVPPLVGAEFDLA